MKDDETRSASELLDAARQTRAEALRRWMSPLCDGLMRLLGTMDRDWKAWRGE